ncbi:MAG: glycoside hydrolase family 20 zincin-like fold domain-containing protein, partial [Alistipes sp.]|nr:glycoside hydrolase family 20 zincin-like fold domain-containing protein [Alistipes sp.]
MKKLFFLLCACSLSGAALGAGPEANIVPRPASVVPGEGTFTLTASTVIGTGRDARLRNVAELFAEAVEPVLGGRMKSAAGGAVNLTTDDTLAAEAYVLEITPSGVTVRGGTAQGVFYGLQSLRQLVVNGCGVLPAVTVKDRPFFGHRG